MRIDPEIEALRNDPVAQRRVQTRMDLAAADWRADPVLQPLLEQFSNYASGEALESLSRLKALVQDTGAAREFLGGWLEAHLAALRDARLAQIPYRHSYSSGFATIQILSDRGATLALAVYEQRPDPVAPNSAIFSDREQHEIVIAGQAQAMFSRWERASRKLETDCAPVASGYVLSLDCNRTMRQWLDVKGQLVILQLSRTPEHPGKTRELRLEDGALLLQSDGDKRASQSSMALAVLGAMERSDAVPLMENLTLSGPAHLRWEAARQILALDPYRGMAALDRMALAPGDELAVPAKRLAAQLRAQYPALRQGEPA